MQSHLMEIMANMQKADSNQTDREQSGGDLVFEDALSDPDEDHDTSYPPANTLNEQKLYPSTQGTGFKYNPQAAVSTCNLFLYNPSIKSLVS